jgi:hypothetical protein
MAGETTTMRQLTTRPAVARAEGRSIGHPVDVLVDMEKHRVVLVVFARDEILELSVVCGAAAVESLANDAVAVKDIASLHLAVHNKARMEDVQEGLAIRGRGVFTKDGVPLAHISSILINAQGDVIEYRARNPCYKGGWLRGETS